jgi:voltage-gated potassium channel
MDKRLEVVIASLTIASVVVAVLLYTVPLSENQISAIYIFDFIVVIILAADFCVRLRGSKQKLRYLLKNWYEIPAMIPLYVFGAIEAEPLIGGALRTFRLIRLFRLLRLLRVINLFRTAKYLKASGFIYFLIISSVAIIFGSLGIYAVEKETPGSTIKNIGDAFWFAFTTITTTGYGDVYPITAEGRIISGILISIGIAVILGFVSKYGAILMQAREKSKNNFAVETKNIIKGKIDALENLHKEEISILVAMITSLHGILQTEYYDRMSSSSSPSSSCPRCGNNYPDGSAFCNGCGYKIRQ